MACISTKICSECRNEYQGDIHNHICICWDCEKKIKEAKEKAHFDELDKLTPEERLRRVEKWIYEYKPQHVSPTRFG